MSTKTFRNPSRLRPGSDLRSKPADDQIDRELANDRPALDLAIVAVIAVVGLAYYFLFLEPRKDRYWNVAGDTSQDVASISRRPS